MMLTVKDLNVYYDSIHAIKNISFSVEEGEIVTLIGANGAGKTTILQTISGLLPAKSGEIHFLGHDLRKTVPHKIVALGLAQVPEGRRIFSHLSVMENISMGAYIRKDKEGFSRTLRWSFSAFPA